jgi:hypothetical protein
MHVRSSPSIALCAIPLLLLLARPDDAASRGGAPEQEFTVDFDLIHADFSPNGRNRFFSLQPGFMLRLEGDDDGEFVEVEIEALDHVRMIPFELNGQPLIARCRVVREREWVDDELVEVSRNYMARDTRTGNIYYFGEDVDNYEDGVIVNHDGAWRAGVNGATPGLLIPSVFLLGARYYQEQAPGVALDRAKHTQDGLTIVTPAGTFENCVMVRETSALESGASTKIYAPGIGLIVDDGIELTDFNLP